MAPSNFVSAAILFVQSLPLATGSYGGLSGHDSVWRGMCALVDQTLNFILFFGLVNLCFPSSKFRLARMDSVHTTSSRPNYRSTVVNFRASWLDIGDMASRSGEFRVVWSKGGQTSLEDVEANLRLLETDTAVSLAPNTNHWIYPYMLGKLPREAGGVLALSRRCCIKTAALTISRFAIVLATSIIIIIFHILIIGILFEDVLVKTVLIFADIGRWILVVGQASSVLTYSLDYKGICSWASPEEYQASEEYGTCWTALEQKFCRDEALRYIGKMHHARAVFCLIEALWPKVAPKFDTPGRTWGTALFATFKCLDEQSFQEEQSTLLHLKVKSRGTGDLCNDFHDGYSIYFRMPTSMVLLFFSSRLYANPEQRKWNFVVLAPLCLCSISGPFVLLWRDGSSSNPTMTLIVSAILQIVCFAFNYKDVDDWSINCKFEATPQFPQLSNTSSSQHQTNSAVTLTENHVCPHAPADTASVASTSTAPTSAATTRLRVAPLDDQDVTERR